MEYFLNKCGDFIMGDGILWMKIKNWMIECLLEFYREMFSVWGKFLDKVVYDLYGRENILN